MEYRQNIISEKGCSLQITISSIPRSSTSASSGKLCCTKKLGGCVAGAGAGDGERGGDGDAAAWAIRLCAMRYLSCKLSSLIFLITPSGTCSRASFSESYNRCFVCRSSPCSCLSGDGVVCASTGTFSRGARTSSSCCCWCCCCGAGCCCACCLSGSGACIALPPDALAVPAPVAPLLGGGCDGGAPPPLTTWVCLCSLLFQSYQQGSHASVHCVCCLFHVWICSTARPLLAYYCSGIFYRWAWRMAHPHRSAPSLHNFFHEPDFNMELPLFVPSDRTYLNTRKGTEEQWSVYMRKTRQSDCFSV